MKPTRSSDPAPGRVPSLGSVTTSGVYAGRVLGIPVYFAPSWFLVAALITYFFAPQFAGQLPQIGAARYLVSFLFAVLLYLSVFVHELGHSVVAKGLGLPVRRITLQLLGGVSEIEREPETPAREYLVAVAGPLVSLLLAGVGFALVNLLRTPGQGSSVHEVLALQLALSNGLVAAFNLLPGLPLDGGRVLRALVWGVSGRPWLGSQVAGWAGRVLAVVVIAAPFLIAGLAGNAADLVNVVYFALLGAFIWSGAGAAIRVGNLQRRLPGLQLRTLARRALAVPADLPLAEALRRAELSGARALVVVTRDGRAEAVVSEAAVAATPAARRPWVTVGTVARALTQDLVLDVDLSGSELLQAVRRTPAPEYLVVERSGAVFGVASAADISGVVAGPQAPGRSRTPVPAASA